MRNLIGKLGALVAGAVAMYYLDPQQGAQRRAALCDLLLGGLGRPADRTRTRVVRNVYHLAARADPQADAELRDRIQQRLGQLVSHPGAIQVSVEDGVVRLSGHVLAKERDGLLLQVQQMAGVQKLVNAMAAHDSPGSITGADTREDKPQAAA